MQASNIAHRNIKSKNEPLLDQHFLAFFLNPERFARTPRTEGDSLRFSWSQSTASHAGGGTWGMHWRSPFWATGILMRIWDWFKCIWFRVKRGNLWPILIILRTGKSPSFWVLPRSWSWHRLTLCSGPLPLTGLVQYTFGSGHLPMTTNFPFLYLFWILLWPSGCHIIEPFSLWNIQQLLI